MADPAINTAVNLWFAERCACGALARDTEAYNQVATALPDLIGRLGGEVPVPAEPETPPETETPPEAPAEASTPTKRAKA